MFVWSIFTYTVNVLSNGAMKISRSGSDSTPGQRAGPRSRTRRSNAERHAVTRATLLAAARELFARKGYADTGTPEIVAAAGLTRGALYYHFTDKRDLFRAVLEAEEALLTERIEAHSAPEASEPMAALMAGTRAFLSAATDPGTHRIVFLDGPAVLGWEEWNEIDARFAAGSLRAGLEAAVASGAMRSIPLDAMTDLLSAACNEAALALASGRHDAAALEETFALLLGGLARSR